MKEKTKKEIRTLILLGFLFAFPYLLLHATFVHHSLVNFAAQLASLEVHFEKSRLSLVRGQIELSHIQVSDQKGRFELSLERLKIALSLKTLIRGRPIFSLIEFSKPHLQLKKMTPHKQPLNLAVLKKIIQPFGRSLFLQNLVLDKILMTSLLIEGPDQPPILVKEIEASLEPTPAQEVGLTLRLADLYQKKLLLESFSADLSLSKQGVALRELTLKKGENHLWLQANWKGDEAKGRLDLRGVLSFLEHLKNPLHFQIKADLENQRATIQNLTATLEEGVLQGKGTLDLRTLTYELPFEAEKVTLEAIFQKMEGPILQDARGNATVQGKFHGTLPQWKAEANATIENFRHHELAASSAKGTLAFDWPRLEFQAALYPAEEERGSVQGAVSFRKDPRVGKLKTTPEFLTLELRQAPLSSLLPELNLKGLFSGSLNLKGVEQSLAGPGKALVEGGQIGLFPFESVQSSVTIQPQGHVILSETRVDLPNLDPMVLPESFHIKGEKEAVQLFGTPSKNLSFKGNYRGEEKTLTVEEAVFKSNAGSLHVSGKLIEKRLDLQTKGGVNLASLRLFQELFGESSGKAGVDLRIQGTRDAPELQGTILLEQALFEMKGLGETVSDLNGTLLFEKNRISPNLHGRLGNGLFSLKGSLTHQNFKPDSFDLKLAGTGLPLQRPNLRLEVSGEVTLKGKWPSPLLAGQLQIIEGRYSKQFEIREFVLRPTSTKLSEKEKIPPELRLALDVKSTGEIQIHSNIATIFLSCDLSLKGTAGSPRIQGAFTLIEGTFQYLRANFTLIEGRMEFVDPDRKEPYLIVIGEQEIPPDDLITLKIEGFLNNLVLSLSSEPSRKRDDILSLIAVGMTREELEQQGGLGRQLGQEVAWEEATRPLEGILSRAVGFNVNLEPSQTGNFSPSRVAVGGSVTDRLSFELLNDFAPETAERTVQANYHLTDNVLLEAFRTRTAGTEPKYRLNLSVKFRIR